MLEPDQVLARDIVANSTMNRERARTGVNSYERELGFDPLQRLLIACAARGSAVWYDACCGEGKALREAYDDLRPMRDRDDYAFYGADLVGSFPPGKPNLRLVAADVLTYDPGVPVDLITCVHGLHYLGDKLGFLEHAYRLLMPSGMFIGHLDLANIRIRNAEPLTWRALAARPRAAKVTVKFSRHLLTLEKTAARFSFGLRYLGATVSETPNYTGITVMDSWYEPIASVTQQLSSQTRHRREPRLPCQNPGIYLPRNLVGGAIA